MTLTRSKMAPEDFWFSQAVKFRDNFTCQLCGAHCPQRTLNNPDLPRTEIECMHFFKRGNHSTRFDLKLSMAGCWKCHSYYEDRPAEWEELLRRRMGDKVYDAAKQLSRMPDVNFKYRRKEIALHFKELVKRQARASGRVWIIQNNLGQKELRELL